MQRCPPPIRRPGSARAVGEKELGSIVVAVVRGEDERSGPVPALVEDAGCVAVYGGAFLEREGYRMSVVVSGPPPEEPVGVAGDRFFEEGGEKGM